MPRSLPALTSLRCFAALAVLGFHLVAFRSDWPGWLRTLYDRVLVEGHAGVAFFFILSGFILTWNYADRDLARGPARRHFHVMRIARILPVHLASFAVAAAALVVTGRLEPSAATAAGAVLNPLLLQAWVPDVDVFHGFNAVSWSLSVEAFFYAVFPAALLASMRLTGGWPARRFVSAMSVVWGVAVAVTLLVPTVLSEGVATWALSTLPVGLLYLFVLGILLGLGCRAGWSGLEARALANRRAFAAIELGAPLVLLLQVLAHQEVPFELRFSAYYVPMICVIIGTQAIGTGPLARVLHHGALQHLGEISYSIYMWHWLVIMLVAASGLFAGHGVLAAMAVVVVTIACSHASYRFVETPARHAIRRRFGRPPYQSRNETSSAIAAAGAPS